tara:strand:- start:7526 stop:7783 length:258 start_codon:yes stop_codon:yes gene_type:complete
MPRHRRKSMGDEDMGAIARMEKGGIVKMMKGGRVRYKKGGLVDDLQKLEAGGKVLKPIPEGNKGLPNLPKKVRNKMGFMKKGGIV